MSDPAPLFDRLALIGVGLIGSSIARAAREHGAARTHRRDRALRRRRASASLELGIADQVVETNAAAVEGADLVIVCIPVGACGAVARRDRPASQARRHRLRRRLGQGLGGARHGAASAGARAFRAGASGRRHREFRPRRRLRRAVRQPLVHPHAARRTPTRRRSSGSPRSGARSAPMSRPWRPSTTTWCSAITSHLPHLIAYTIVGTADELGEVTQSEVLKFSAGGFRDFTRIAASDPTMWRDVFLANKDAVLEMLGTLQRGPVAAHARDPPRRRRRAVRAVHPHPRDPPRHRADRPGLRRAGLRPPASAEADRAAAAALRGRQRVEFKTAAASARAGSGRASPRRR